MTGTESIAPLIISALVAAGGTYAQMSATQKAQKRKNDIINLTMANQGERQKVVNAANIGAAKVYNPETRAQKFEEQAQTSEGTINDFMNQYRENNPRTPVQGRVSSDYLTTQAGRDSELAKRAAKIVTLMSKVTAPGYQQNEEALANAQAAEIQGGAAAATTAETRGTQSAIDTLQPNPNAMVFGNLASNLGSTFMGNYLADMARTKAKTPAPPKPKLNVAQSGGF